MARLHKAPSRDLQIRDVAAGLIAAFEEKPELVGPLKVDYIHLAGAIVEALDPVDPGR
jgi:hypothetical protein